MNFGNLARALAISLLFATFFPISLLAQKIDTSLLLPEVTIMETYRTTPTKDSLSRMPILPFIDAPGTLADVLSNYSPIFIKQYGAGQLASSSIRGGSAAHTTLKWNGISLQNPMLGQVDLSSFPAFFMDKIGLSYGNEYGLNATEIGAVIHTDNLPLDQIKHRLRIQSSVGSFGQYKLGIATYFHKKKWHSHTRLFGLRQENDFPYIDLLGQPTRQTHAQKTQLAILQEFGFHASAHSEWTARIWLQQNHRQIPKNKLQNEQVAQQENESIRTQLSWKNNRNSSFNFAFIDDDFIYDDSLKSIHSLNHFNTLLASYLYDNKSPITWALHYQYSSAKSNNYDQKNSRQEWKTEVRYQYQNSSATRKVTTQLQVGITDGQFTPVLPSISLLQYNHPRLRWKWSIARKYRLPSFNDLYWEEGGNPDLNPEKGWESTFSNVWKYTYHQLDIHTTITLFGKLINDWIIWQPGASGLWSPSNAQQVGSRGLELQGAIQQSKGRFPWSLSAQYFFTRTSQLKTTNASLKNQLIYQPLHQAIIRGLLQLHSWELSYHHKITGKVFTTADNTESLPGYDLGNLTIEKEWNLKKHQLTTSLRIENIWNKDFETVAFYPMPGRSWQLNFNYHF